MNRAEAADICVIFNYYVTGKGYAIRQDRVVSDNNIVSHVNVGHQQVSVSDRGGHTAAFCSAMDSYELPNRVAVPDARLRNLPFVFLILRCDATGAIRIEQVPLADSQLAFQINMRHQARAGANRYAAADYAIRSNLSFRGNARVRIDDRCGMDSH